MKYQKETNFCSAAPCSQSELSCARLNPIHVHERGENCNITARCVFLISFLLRQTNLQAIESCSRASTFFIHYFAIHKSRQLADVCCKCETVECISNSIESRATWIAWTLETSWIESSLFYLCFFVGPCECWQWARTWEPFYPLSSFGSKKTTADGQRESSTLSWETSFEFSTILLPSRGMSSINRI